MKQPRLVNYARCLTFPEKPIFGIFARFASLTLLMLVGSFLAQTPSLGFRNIYY